MYFSFTASPEDSFSWPERKLPAFYLYLCFWPNNNTTSRGQGAGEALLSCDLAGGWLKGDDSRRCSKEAIWKSRSPWLLLLNWLKYPLSFLMYKLWSQRILGGGEGSNLPPRLLFMAVCSRLSFSISFFSLLVQKCVQFLPWRKFSTLQIVPWCPWCHPRAIKTAWSLKSPICLQRDGVASQKPGAVAPLLYFFPPVNNFFHHQFLLLCDNQTNLVKGF